MRKLASILLASDFRPASREAARATMQLATAFQSRVTLLHAIEPLPNWPVARHEREKEAPLQEVVKSLTAQKVEVAQASIVIGPPVDAILHKAREIDADLILIGAGDRTGKFRFSGGPTAMSVIEHAPQPVLAVRPGTPELRFKKILCPVDQSGASARGLRNAIQIARVFGGEIVALTVAPDVNWLTAAVETGQFANAKAEYEAKWQAEFDTFIADTPSPEVKITKELRHGDPSEQIVAAVADHQADAIVMGATGRTGLVRILLGSTTRRVLEQLPCSILTVKEEDVVNELFESEVKLIRLLLAEGRELLGARSYEAALVKFRQVLGHDQYNVAATLGQAEAHEKLGHRELAQYYRRRAEGLQEKVWT